MQKKNGKFIIKLIAIVVVQVFLLNNSVLAMNSYKNQNKEITWSTLSPKVTFSNGGFKQNFELLSNSLNNNSINLPQFDGADYNAVFSGVNFSRFSEIDAAKLKIAILLQNTM